MTKKSKLTILKGEGANQHVLHGSISYSEIEDYMCLEVEKAELKHETLTGEFAEHNTLQVPNGKLHMGVQVEKNPFSGEINRILD